MKYKTSVYLEIEFDPSENKRIIYLGKPDTSKKVVEVVGDDIIYEYSFQVWNYIQKVAVVKDKVANVRSLSDLKHIISYLVDWGVTVVYYCYDSDKRSWDFVKILEKIGIKVIKSHSKDLEW